MIASGMDRAFNIDRFLRTVRFEYDPGLDCRHPVVQQTLETWEALRGTREMPARADIDPVRLPRAMLPNMFLFDILREPELRYRWRLIGTRLVEVLGRDATGTYWDELYTPEILVAMRRHPDWVMEHRRPLRSLGQAPNPDRSYLRSENLYLPLSSNGDDIDMLLGVSVYS